MGGKSQSVIFRAVKRVHSGMLIRKEYGIFRQKCGFTPALSESLFFKSCCAALIEDLGFIPPTYAGEAAAYLRLHRSGRLKAGQPAVKPEVN